MRTHAHIYREGLRGTHTHTYIYIYMYCIHTYVHTHTYYMYVYMYTQYIYTHTHTFIHIIVIAVIIIIIIIIIIIVNVVNRGNCGSRKNILFNNSFNCIYMASEVSEEGGFPLPLSTLPVNYMSRAIKTVIKYMLSALFKPIFFFFFIPFQKQYPVVRWSRFPTTHTPNTFGDVN